MLHPRARRIAMILLTSLLAHLVLMVSPLHAAPEHQTYSAWLAVSAHSEPEASSARLGGAPALTALLSTPHVGSVEDCSLAPGPTSKPLRIDSGVGWREPLGQLFPRIVAPHGGAAWTPAYRTPAAARALLQVFRN